ncbi:MAG TPA: DUF2065 domain-containing protein [Oxalobacteraceae bacterium]|nr:DUF2065 domain-containing protein [Oxalobacteraceae bacterium]
MDIPWLLVLGLILVFEGVMPLLFPAQWRETFQRILQFSNGQLRFFGLIALLAGLALVSLVYFF